MIHQLLIPGGLEMSKFIKDALRGLATLLLLYAFLFLGNQLNRILFFIPGPILGMLLFLLALQIRVIPYNLIRDFSKLLVSHMSLFLIPVSVSMLLLFKDFRTSLLPMLLVLLFSLIFTLTVTGAAASRFSSGSDQQQEDHHE